MGIRVNFAEVEEKDFAAFPSGTYNAKVTDAEDVEVKNQGKLDAGTPGTKWEFTIQDGPEAGKKCWTNTWLAPNSIWALKQLLAATGRFTDEQLAGELDFTYDQVIGSDVQVKTVRKLKPDGDANDPEDYNNDVRKIKPIGTPTDAPMAGAGASMLP